jgi:mediator of RNA polymerase II transcription subunit 14
VHLCADETVVVTVEPRSGKISLRDTGDLGAAGRAPRDVALSEKMSENPTLLLIGLPRLRVNVCAALSHFPVLLSIHGPQTIIELAEQKANYLGFQTFKQRNFPREGKRHTSR